MNHLALLLLRISFSILMLTHGIPKLTKVLSGDFGFADPLGLGVTITLIFAIIGEVFAPVLIIIGYKTKWSTLPVIITMSVAAFVVHAGDPIGTQEKALLYLFGFIAIALLGGGRYSVDRS